MKNRSNIQGFFFLFNRMPILFLFFLILGCHCQYRLIFPEGKGWIMRIMFLNEFADMYNDSSSNFFEKLGTYCPGYVLGKPIPQI